MWPKNTHTHAHVDARKWGNSDFSKTRVEMLRLPQGKDDVEPWLHAPNRNKFQLTLNAKRQNEKEETFRSHHMRITLTQ